MTDVEKELDRALTGRSHRDDVAPLAETAAELRSAFAADVPEARAEFLFFTSAVGLRKRSPLILRWLVPAIAVGCVAAALVLVSRTAVPGDSLYPVRGVLKQVGLASAPTREVDREIRIASNLLSRAETALLVDPDRAEDLAHEAIDHLGDAGDLIEDLDDDDRAERLTTIGALGERASEIIVRAEIAEDRLEGADDDNSGPGSGDDDGGDDNSGSGSDDDSSGPGSGGDDENSGSGGGSGSGSGSDGGGGSGSSGSGSDDGSGTD